MPNWKKIKAEYIRGGVSYRKLAEKYGVSFSTLRKVASKEKWTDLRNKAGAKRDSKIVESIASQEAKRVDRVNSIADKLLTRIEECVDDGSIFAVSKGLKDITSALKEIRDIKGMKSELDMQEQMARIEKLRKEASDDDANKDTKIVVEMKGELDSWSD